MSALDRTLVSLGICAAMMCLGTAGAVIGFTLDGRIHQFFGALLAASLLGVAACAVLLPIVGVKK